MVGRMRWWKATRKKMRRRRRKRKRRRSVGCGSTGRGMCVPWWGGLGVLSLELGWRRGRASSGPQESRGISNHRFRKATRRQHQNHRKPYQLAHQHRSSPSTLSLGSATVTWNPSSAINTRTSCTSSRIQITRRSGDGIGVRFTRVLIVMVRLLIVSHHTTSLMALVPVV